MFFTIVITTKDAKDTIAETLESILAQRFSDFEVVVIDGCSADTTVAIVKKYSKDFGDRLRLKVSPDSGIYDAMNKGIGLASGEWLYFLGSGDVLFDKDVLERVSRYIGQTKPDVVYGDVKFKDTGEIYGGRFSKIKFAGRNISHQAIFYKRDLFDRFGLYETKYKILADYAFNIKWFNDKSVVKKYINLLIAVYENGGFSYGSNDEEFWRDRDGMVRKYFPRYVIATRFLYKSVKRFLIGTLLRNKKAAESRSRF